VTTRFSAYLSIYNDWDILGHALHSIAPRIDELVIVDGAYRWMVPFLKAIGVNPERSDNRVFEVIANVDVPVKVVCGLWDDEIAKRMAGYNACSHRYVYRIDADEVLTFRDADLDAFLMGRRATAAMEMPLFVAPGWFRAGSKDAPIEQQGLLFDREQISAEEHLRYLWLVLGKQGLPLTSRDLPVLFEQPIAFNTHLTAWRTPATAITRAAFYKLNYFRNYGFPWLLDTNNAPVTDIVQFCERIDPVAFRAALLFSEIVVNPISLHGGMLRHKPLSPNEKVKLAPLFDMFLDELARLNVELGRKPHPFVANEIIHLDLSTRAAIDALVEQGHIFLDFSDEICAATARLRLLFTAEPWEAIMECSCVIQGKRLVITVVDACATLVDTGGEGGPLLSNVLRRSIEIQVWTSSKKLLLQLCCRH
jgi:hypothetical protein